MYQIANKLFLWSLLVLLLASCSKDDTSGENVVFDIEDEFHLNLKEELGLAENRNLLFEISSIREFDCENYLLNAAVNRVTEGRISIAVTELIEPMDCIVGQAPATAEVSVSELNQKEYLLNVALVNQIENEGILRVFPDYYELTIQQENGIQLPYPRLQRIPNQSIWGYVAYEDAHLDMANALVEDLRELIEFPYFTPGNYGHFLLKDSGELELKESDFDANKQQQTFLFQVKGSMEEFRQKVEDTYCPLYQDQIDLKIYTAEGDVIGC